MERSRVIRAHLKKGVYVYATPPRYGRVCVYAPNPASTDDYSFMFTISRTELAARLRAFRRAGYRLEYIRPE